MLNKFVNRQEYKYFIKNEDILYLRNNISKFMHLDKNACKNSYEYTVNTLYFDSIFETCLDEKMDGINFREKFRLRTYGDKNSILKLESKQRMDTAIAKKSYEISFEEAEKLRSCSYDFLKRSKNNFFKEIYIKFKTKMYSPSVIVCYEREAYELPYGNIRITFDKNLRTHNANHNIFNNKGGIPIFENNYQILEVKYSIELPDHLKRILSNVIASRSAISKFVYAQKYKENCKWRDAISEPR